MTAQRVAEVAASGFTLLEGPRWHDGKLWTSDFFSHRVLRFDVTARGPLKPETVCVVDGQPSGLGFMPDGELRISSMLDCRLLAWDGKRLDVVADYSDLVTGPSNDVAIDSAGIALVGNFGLDPSNPSVALPTSLLRIMPDGAISVAADDVLFPNGIVIDERAGIVYLAETYRARITAWDYRAGELTDRRVWHQFSPDPGVYDIPTVTPLIDVVPDGLAQDAEGMLWVADAKGHGISRIDQHGTVVDFVETGLAVYAAVLGGADGRDLLMCCAPPVETFDASQESRSVLMRCRVDVPGV